MKDETIDIITKNNKVIGQENKYVAHQKELSNKGRKSRISKNFMGIT